MKFIVDCTADRTPNPKPVEVVAAGEAAMVGARVGTKEVDIDKKECDKARE